MGSFVDTCSLYRGRGSPVSLGNQKNLLIILAVGKVTQRLGLTSRASSSHWAVFVYLIWAFPPHYTNTPANRAWPSCKSLLPTGILSSGPSSPLLLCWLPSMRSCLRMCECTARGKDLQKSLFCRWSCSSHSQFQPPAAAKIHSKDSKDAGKRWTRVCAMRSLAADSQGSLFLGPLSCASPVGSTVRTAAAHSKCW